jgi:hypothetical protein
MFKLEQYKVLTASLITAATLMSVGQANETTEHNGLWNAKKI